MKVNDLVRQVHVHDGTKYAGAPTGPTLRIVKTEQVVVSEGGQSETIIWLSDGSWQFPWNLHEEQ